MSTGTQEHLAPKNTGTQARRNALAVLIKRTDIPG